MREDRRVQQALVDLARRGDEEAFADLARAVGDRLMAIAFRILRDADRAEDAVQHTLVTAWRELPTLRDDDRFDAWLRRILVHACYAEARRRRIWAANVRLLPTDEPDGSDDMAAVVERDRLERGFRRLTPEHRAIFVLHHYVGLTLPEVADELGLPLGTVKSRLHYAVQALRAALDADARPAIPRERPA
jgi:RNA polymerase sigma-70 factor (ECF subfamily)